MPVKGGSIVQLAKERGWQWQESENKHRYSGDTPWLGFPCRQSRVLCINMEIDRDSCLHRLADVYDAMGIPHPHSGNFKVWNLRGHALLLDQLAPIIIRRVKKRGYDAIIFDPIY